MFARPCFVIIVLYGLAGIAVGAGRLKRLASRGGKHQRLRRFREITQIVAEENAGPLDGDGEVELLVELFGLGMVSANTLQQIGAAANLVAPRPQTQIVRGQRSS